MIEMVRRFLRQKFGSPAMAIALAILALLTAGQGALADPEQALGSGFLAVLLLAAGSVSRDASGGTLQMILARPIRRTSYLFGRYLGILAAYAIFLVAAGGLSVFFAAVLPRMLGAVTTPALAPAAIARGAGAAMLSAAFFAAILLFFSTFLRGYADVLAFIVLQGILALIPGVGQALRRPWLSRAGEALRANILPRVDWGEVLRGQGVLGEATGRWVLALTTFLILAAVVFSRREFSYGHD